MAEYISKKRAEYGKESFVPTKETSVENIVSPVLNHPNATVEQKLYEVLRMISNPIENEALLFGLIELLRKSITTDILADQLVQSGAITCIVPLLSHSSLRVCSESIWVLNNVAASHTDNTKTFILLEIPKKLLELLESERSTFELKELV